MTDKLKIWFTVLPLSLFVLSAVVANESNTNEHKDNGTGHTISNADDVRHTDSNTGINVDTVAETGDQPQNRFNDNSDYFEQMQQRRREVQQAQREAYLRHLERRAQQAPVEIVDTNIAAADDVIIEARGDCNRGVRIANNDFKGKNVRIASTVKCGVSDY